MTGDFSLKRVDYSGIEGHWNRFQVLLNVLFGGFIVPSLQLYIPMSI